MRLTALAFVASIGALELVRHLLRKQKGRKPEERETRQDDLLPTCEDSVAFQTARAPSGRDIGDIALGPKLGSGSFGVVYAGRWKGSTVAIKVIKHQRHGYASNDNVSREMMIGVASIHPNIVAVYDVFTERMQLRAFSDQSTAAFNLQTFMVMELCDRGSLFKRREDGWKILQEDFQKGLQWVFKCLLEIVYALEYLQSLSVIHGDLKCANVLCKSSTSDFRGFTCKVCDFGLSNTLAGVSSEGSSQAGTLIFAAPEILDGGSQNPSSDVYSFGMLAYHLFSMGHLDTDLMEYQIHHQIVENGWRPALPDKLLPEIKDWINRCWLKDMSARPTFVELRHILSEQLYKAQMSSRSSGDYRGQTRGT